MKPEGAGGMVPSAQHVATALIFGRTLDSVTGHIDEGKDHSAAWHITSTEPNALHVFPPVMIR